MSETSSFATQSTFYRLDRGIWVELDCHIVQLLFCHVDFHGFSSESVKILICEIRTRARLTLATMKSLEPSCFHNQVNVHTLAAHKTDFNSPV